MGFFSDKLMEDIYLNTNDVIGKNDKGHDWNHGLEVFTIATSINMQYKVYDNELDIMTAALLHDIGIIAGRKNHHRVGVWMLKEGHYSKWFNSIIKPYDLNKKNILKAIEEHRASGNYKFYSPLSRLISMSDRGIPDIFRTVKRLKDINHNLRFTIKHIFEKYSENGYIKYDDLYKEYYGEKFKQFMYDCNNIDLIVKIYESC